MSRFSYLVGRFSGVHPWPVLGVPRGYLTEDLDVTRSILRSVNEDDDPKSETLRYLIEEGLIFVPQDLGYSSGTQFVTENLLGTAASIHAELSHVGNPAGIEDDEAYLVGQPDVGDFAEHDGWHPRDKSLGSVPHQQRMYESLLLRRNAALLRQAGLPDVAVVGRLLDDEHSAEYVSPIWKVIIREMPQLDTRASWRDVLDFRRDERTRHLVRRLRRWVRKTVCEAWTEAELHDEVRDLIYEYENHIRTARMGADKGILELVITGVADLVENVAKLRFGKIGRLVSVARERKVKLLEAEAGAPGRELALLSELNRSSPHIVGQPLI